MTTTRNGSTWQWRKLRNEWQTRINNTPNGIPCWRNCGTTIQPFTHNWHLGHTTDKIAGGNDNNARPECTPCNLHHGGRTGAHRKQQQRYTPAGAL